MLEHMDGREWIALTENYSNKGHARTLDNYIANMSPEEARDVAILLGEEVDRFSADRWLVLAPIFSLIATSPGGHEELERWINSNHTKLSSWQIYRLANKAAWATRGVDSPAVESVDSKGTQFLFYLTLERKRFTFDEKSMNKIIADTYVAPEFDNAVISALRAFVDIRLSYTTEEVQEVVRRTLVRREVKEFREVTYDIVAHAIWLNVTLPESGRLLEEVCVEWYRARANPGPIADFRYAAALRLQGKYREAIRRSEKALAQTDGTTEFGRTFSEQCIRERELSVAGMATEEAKSKVDQQVVTLERKVDDIERRSMARIVEVLTLFTAASAFALGGVSVIAGGTANPKQMSLVLSGFASGLIMFVLLTLFAVELTSPGPLNRRRHAYFLSVAAFFATLLLLGGHVLARI